LIRIKTFSAVPEADVMNTKNTFVDFFSIKSTVC
jgi:hypothetical protein